MARDVGWNRKTDRQRQIEKRERETRISRERCFERGERKDTGHRKIHTGKKRVRLRARERQTETVRERDRDNQRQAERARDRDKQRQTKMYKRRIRNYEPKK